MAMIKICPSCGTHNDIAETICKECMADISSVTPVDDSQANNATLVKDSGATVIDSGATRIERRNLLRFEASDGSGGFTAGNNAIIGREGEGREYLSKYMTVSRRHARLIYDNDSWLLEDLNSSNGTYINARRLEQGEKSAIKSGDSVALSHSCTFNIKE